MQVTLTNSYLKTRKESGEIVELFLLNGVRLVGKVKDFDDECIVLNTDQIVMRNAFSTIQLQK